MSAVTDKSIKHYRKRTCPEIFFTMSPNEFILYCFFSPCTYYEDWCRQDCLDDCFCAVVIFKEDSCWKKGIPLITGRADPTVGAKALIKTGKELYKYKKGW
ncbi:G-type lectin S-receptor-like serine/threonine-protein kinase LECRK3 [Prunus yedoensis var. nudiflora]|uniref:G-type lectin S-receptor-like serine/threonine-protein kinase LECRK3 n=1 Tax=Prunus yedoensis var. nudiflora TaxID=2094558 RepID=A0A314YDC3_PRUYE|nr:G-type lectin S-receptor-like serine/threonine-protein kinase LECRK3 [Prunus yedoensis var. nudiflora]